MESREPYQSIHDHTPGRDLRSWGRRLLRQEEKDLLLRTFISLVLTTAAIGLIAGYFWVSPQEVSDRIEFIRTIAQILAGLVVLLGLYFTYQSVRTSQKNTMLTQMTVENAIAQLHIDRDTKISTLYYQASEQLGDQSEARRIAGLYGLERIASSHDEFYQSCIEVVCAFIRTRSGQIHIPDPLTDSYRMPEDVAVAWSVLARRKHAYKIGEDLRLPLTGAKAVGLSIENGDFCGAHLDEADLRNSFWTRCRFTDASLFLTNFGACRVYGCDFTHCWFDSSEADDLVPVYSEIQPQFRHNPLVLSEPEIDVYGNSIFQREDCPATGVSFDPHALFNESVGLSSEFWVRFERNLQHAVNEDYDLPVFYSPPTE